MKVKKAHLITTLIVAILFSIVKFSQDRCFAPLMPTKEGYLVNYIIDGDTIELSNGERVRYIGIDTPEIRQKQGSKWIYNPMPYAEESKASNKKLVEGKSVRLEFDVEKKDRYNRWLAYVYIGDKMVNLELVKQGYAMIYTRPPNVKYVDEFVKAQKDARENKRGLWGDLASQNSKITTNEAKENIGKMKIIEAKVVDTYLTEKVLILKFRDNFKAVIFKNNFSLFPKEALRSPERYFKGKTIRVYGIIKEYKTSPEIILNDPSQMEIVEGK